MNFIPAKITSRESRLYVDAGSFELETPSEKETYLQTKKGQEVILGIRPEHMEDKSFAEKGVFGDSLKAVVEVVEILGSEVQLDVSAGEHSLIARVDPRTQAKIQEGIELAVNMDKIHLFEREPPNRRL
ncbi:MAG: TOBE domain-containing protein [Desulfatiglandaceae bacterium]